MLDLVGTSDAVLAVGVTLVNFLWQAAIVGLVTAVVLAACPRATAGTRYAVACLGLLSMTAAPAITFALVWRAPASAVGADAAVTADTAVSVLVGAASIARLDSWLPDLVSTWALVVTLLTVRLVRSWWRTERVRRRDAQLVPDDLAIGVQHLAASLGIARRVSVVRSPWVDVPTVIGWVRPTILLPIGALTGLSTQQLEAILSHELAHIRRHDYLVNSLQNIVETLFFFHPSVWWLSRQVRIEREHCCDDVAVGACGSAVVYARALAALEESRASQMPLALAATGGSLVARVRRLVGPAGADGRQPALPIGVCVVVIMFGVSLTSRAAAPNAIAQPPAPVATPRTAALQSDLRVMREAIDRFHVDKARYPESLEELVSERHLRATALQVVTPVASAPPQPLRVGGNIREPRKTLNVAPTYPQAAREAGIEGIVILEATIDTDGSVANVRVLRSIPDLDQAAINAIRQWRYEPTRLNGEPVAVMMTVTVSFSLTPSAHSTFRIAAPEGSGRSAASAVGGAGVVPGRPSLYRAGPTLFDIPRVGGAIAEPRKVRNVPAVYPKLAQASRVSGTVIMDAMIDAHGNVVNVNVLRSVPMLDQAAIDAVRQWKYEPARLDGVPTAVMMTVVVNFTLN